MPKKDKVPIFLELEHQARKSYAEYIKKNIQLIGKALENNVPLMAKEGTVAKSPCQI